ARASLPAGDDGRAARLAGLAEPRLAAPADGGEPALGGGHHLCAARRGLRLSRRHSGCLPPARRRLDDGRPPAGGAGAGGARYGAGRARGDLRRLGAPLGPRHPVRLRRLYHPADRAWHPAGHEPAGCPYDNAMAESFMRTLKQEEVDGSAYRDLAAAETAIGAFIEEVYNRQRLHSALAYRSPAEFEAVETSRAPVGAAAQQPPLAHNLGRER